MKVSEWLQQQGLTLDSELNVPPLLWKSADDCFDMSGLSEEDKNSVRSLMIDKCEAENIERYIHWLRVGDVGVYNTGASVAEVLQLIENDLGCIKYNLGLAPVEPREYFAFPYGPTAIGVMMRFSKPQQ